MLQSTVLTLCVLTDYHNVHIVMPEGWKEGRRKGMSEGGREGVREGKL